MTRKKANREPELPYTARPPLCGEEGLHYVFCLNCGRVIYNPRKGQKFCRKDTRQRGSCKDKYWSRGLRRLSMLEKEIKLIKDRITEIEAWDDLRAEHEETMGA